MNNMINKLIKNIGKSAFVNKNKNIFYFSDDKYPLGMNLMDGIDRDFYMGENLIEEICFKIVEEYKLILIANNQYIDFNKDLAESIFNIYYDFFRKINICKSRYEMEKYMEEYQSRIIALFSNVDEIKILDNGRESIDRIPCSEYSPEYQMKILKLKLEDIKEPLMDIGAGENGNLVVFLREKGIRAFGIDRNINLKEDYLIEGSWLGYGFEENSYGTIVAHMSFTNHFKREHLKKDGNYISYAKKYMEVLESLKKGGRFYYAPSLEFIENLLPDDEYLVENHDIPVIKSDKDDKSMMGTVILKI